MCSRWLDPDTTDKDKVQEMLDAIPEQVLRPRVVTDRVNSVRNNGPELIESAPWSPLCCVRWRPAEWTQYFGQGDVRGGQFRPGAEDAEWVAEGPA
jgi:hypothetical protein